MMRAPERPPQSGDEPTDFAADARALAETGGRVADACLLNRGIKSILRCDEAEVVAGIARYVMTQHRSLRVGAAFVERARHTPIPAVLALLGGLTRFLELRAPERRDGAVWVARLSNERRAIEPLLSMSPELNWSELKFRRRPDVAALAALVRSLSSNWRRTLRLAHRLHRRYEFFKVLRVVELIGYYTRYLGIFRRGRYRLAVTSNHSNPHGIAFNLAARRCGVPVVLVTHGMPVRPVARLSYDLALVHCEAARQTYLAEGCRLTRVLVHGRRQQYAPMRADQLPARLTVGIFLCKDVQEERLRTIVALLLGDARVARILVRPHPKNLWRGLDAWLAALNCERVERSAGGSVFRDVAAADIVLAGNSSVLVDAVIVGRPAAYVPGLDYGSHDLHAFVARGLIYPLVDELSFDYDAIRRFYQRPDWPVVLRLFANIEEDEAAVSMQACAAMHALNAGD
ncbi:MAG: hypothetical protein ACJ74W_16770 [Pyrinomonadaceae bacterium]